MADIALGPATRFSGSCPGCRRWLTYRPLPGRRAAAPVLPYMGITCRHCGAKATLDADAGQSQRQPLTITRDDLDLSQLRAHCREHHGRRRPGRSGASQGLPRANAHLASWHWDQHHRYGSHAHSHFGPFVLVGNARGSTVGQIARPLGWFTGQDMKTRGQLKAEWQARHPRPAGAITPEDNEQYGRDHAAILRRYEPAASAELDIRLAAGQA